MAEVKKFRVQEKKNEIEENLKKAVKEGIISYKDYVLYIVLINIL